MPVPQVVWRVGAVAALVGAAFPGSARAQEAGRYRLAWTRDEGASGCPAQPVIAREVTRRLRRDPFVVEEGPSIEANVRREGARWIARLVVRDAAGLTLNTRGYTSEAGDCGAIAEAVSLGISLSIDPEAALRPPAPEPPPTPPVPPPVAPPAPDPVAPRPSPAATRAGWHRSLAAHARGVVSAGLLPGAAFGATLAVDLPLTWRLRATASFTWLPEVGAELRGERLAFGLSAGALGVCVDLWRGGASALASCAALHVGALHAVVHQGVPSNPGAQPWVAAGLGLRFRGRIVGPLTAEAGVDALAAMARPRFVQASRGTAFEPEPVGVLGFVGLGLQFR